MIKDFFLNIKKFFPFLKKDLKYSIILFVLIIFIVITSIYTPYLLSKFLSFVINKNYNKVFSLIILLAILKIFNLLFIIINSKIFYKIRKNLIYLLRKEVASKILNLKLTDFVKNGKGKFLQRINYDPYILADSLSYIKDYFIILCTTVGVLGYLIYLNAILGLIYLFFVFLILLLRGYAINKKMKIKNIYFEEQEQNNNYLSELFNGIKDIKELDIDKKFYNTLNKQYYDMENISYKADLRYDIIHKLSAVLDWVGSVFVLIVGVYFLDKEIIILDTFITMFMYRKNVFSFCDVFTDLLGKIASFNLSSKRILELVLTNDKKEYNYYDKKCLGLIEFKNVCFKYDKKNVLDNCSFTFKPNDLYVITGKSGVGKTTIINLISRLYDVNEGTINLDNKNINWYSNDYISNSISIISQNYYLFNMSIKDNLKIVNDKISDEEIYEVCKKVGIHDFIMTLEKKYDTEVGDGGFFLSGGEKQRIAIARAILKRSKVLLLDEATSSLDSENEKGIFELLLKLKENHTIIFVTHKKKYD